MSIATKTGDQGTTALMYHRRVPKNHARVEAYGCVDELSAALGLARAHLTEPALADRLHDIQRDLVVLMGELATDLIDLDRYQKDGFPLVAPALTAKLDSSVREVESQLGTLTGWATPGPPTGAAALELARTVCRRAERHVCGLHQQNQLRNHEIIAYLNRLADLLWLLARLAESTPARQPARG